MRQGRAEAKRDTGRNPAPWALPYGCAPRQMQSLHLTGASGEALSCRQKFRHRSSLLKDRIRPLVQHGRTIADHHIPGKGELTARRFPAESRRWDSVRGTGIPDGRPLHYGGEPARSPREACHAVRVAASQRSRLVVIVWNDLQYGYVKGGLCHEP